MSDEDGVLVYPYPADDAHQAAWVAGTEHFDNGLPLFGLPMRVKAEHAHLAVTLHMAFRDAYIDAMRQHQAEKNRRFVKKELW